MEDRIKIYRRQKTLEVWQENQWAYFMSAPKSKITEVMEKLRLQYDKLEFGYNEHICIRL